MLALSSARCSSGMHASTSGRAAPGHGMLGTPSCVRAPLSSQQLQGAHDRTLGSITAKASKNAGGSGRSTSRSSSRNPSNSDIEASGLGAALAAAREQPAWGQFAAVMGACGAVTGTLLDGIHSKDALQIYDTLPLDFAGLHTSATVPPLLAAFYIVLGALAPLSDAASGGEEDPATAQAMERASDPAWLALGVGVLAANLQLSAAAYASGTPFSTIHLLLGTATAVNWWVFDRTKQGIGLALLCALGAPAAELVLLHFVPLWHYPRADILGGAFVSWVPWCYAFYTPALCNLARFTWTQCKESVRQGSEDSVIGSKKRW